MRQHFSPLDVLSDRAVQEKYRLPLTTIRWLITLVTPHIQRASCRNFVLSPEVQLLAALRFYTVGSFLEVVGDGTSLSKASVSRSVAAVTPILLRHARNHSKMPTTRDEVRQVHQGFHAVAGIPRVIDVVDDTLHHSYPQSLPGGSVLDQQEALRGHQHTGGGGPQRHITDIVARLPGGTHDSLIWANYAVGQKAGREEFGLLGYPPRGQWLSSPELPRHASNQPSNTTRTRVERVFGMWKSRYRCIHRSLGGLRLSPHKCCRVIVVTAMLHNIAVHVGAVEPPPVDDGEEHPEDEAPEPHTPGCASSAPSGWCPD
ncbi:putative nuclease HARBI1 [Sardina pilchardus]|uniref:putative nuclease HARBI1 n=1 Tax=Sardina pilchardus TaxID=27697 RepID=UPI002E128B07